MKHLKGYGKRYFSLAVIAMYSTINRLGRDENNFQYHIKSYEYQEYKTSPPYLIFN